MKSGKHSKINKIHFQVSLPNPHLHQIEIEMSVSTSGAGDWLFTMPTWSPGSYFIRDYSGHIISIQALENGKEIPCVQTELSRFRVQSSKNQFLIRYTLFGYENTVRTNFVDPEYAFLNPPSTFLYPEGSLNIPVSLGFRNHPYQHIYTSLAKGKGQTYKAIDFDELFDSPIFLTNKTSSKFKVEKTEHEIIIQGDINSKIKKNILSDLEKIVKLQTRLFRGNPNSYYLFLLNLTEDNYGGLEHRASSVNAFPPDKLEESAEYTRLMALLCHEYFHLWNIKRIRPIAFGPFDYYYPRPSKELWIAEGITSFYDNYIIFLSELVGSTVYINEVLNDINRLEASSGEEYMSLEESSLTTWIKFYKQHPNSHNFSISYYIKGSILAFCMDISIREKSNLKYSLMDVMRYLLKKYHEEKNRGFTKEEFFKAVVDATGVDVYPEFQPYLETRTRIPFETYFKKIGVKVSKKLKKSSLPFETKASGSLVKIQKVFMQYLKNVDISTGDELIAINNIRVTKENVSKLESHPEKAKLKLILSRRGKILTRTIQSVPIYLYQLDSIDYLENPLGMNFFEWEG